MDLYNASFKKTSNTLITSIVKTKEDCLKKLFKAVRTQNYTPDLWARRQAASSRPSDQRSKTPDSRICVHSTARYDELVSVCRMYSRRSREATSEDVMRWSPLVTKSMTLDDIDREGSFDRGIEWEWCCRKLITIFASCGRYIFRNFIFIWDQNYYAWVSVADPAMGGPGGRPLPHWPKFRAGHGGATQTRGQMFT